MLSLKGFAPAFEMNLVQLFLKGGQCSVIFDGSKEVIDVTDDSGRSDAEPAFYSGQAYLLYSLFETVFVFPVV